MKHEKKTSDSPIVEEVKQLIAEVDSTHRYSMSRIYKAYSTIFGTSEQPQACASCLIRKVKELRVWLEKESAKEKVTTDKKPKEPRTKKVRTKGKA